MSYKIVVDSCCDLSPQMLKDPCFVKVPLTIRSNGSTFVDDEGNAMMYSFPSNISPASQEYEELVAKRAEMIKEAHPEKGDEPIPSDLVTCSGSGLDPDISVAAAQYQVERLAENNDMTTEEVEEIIEKCTNHKFLGIFGEETVNVLKVNLMLEGILE